MADIHPSAVVAESARLADDVVVGPQAVIGADCVIGGAAVVKGHIGLADGTVVMGASTILENVRSKATVMGTPMPPMPARQAHRLWRKLLRMSKTGEGKT